MTIATSAALGTVIAALDGGLFPGITSAETRRRADARARRHAAALVGGASLYIVTDKGDAEAAAAWDFIKYLTSAQTHSRSGRRRPGTCRCARTPSTLEPR